MDTHKDVEPPPDNKRTAWLTTELFSCYLVFWNYSMLEHSSELLYYGLLAPGSGLGSTLTTEYGPILVSLEKEMLVVGSILQGTFCKDAAVANLTFQRLTQSGIYPYPVACCTAPSLR